MGFFSFIVSVVTFSIVLHYCPFWAGLPLAACVLVNYLHGVTDSHNQLDS